MVTGLQAPRLSKYGFIVVPRHSGMLLAGIQPHGIPGEALAWIPAKSMPE
jgi:hypothetical protein